MTTMTTDRPTGIKCGNCKGRHGTPADVKECYATTRRNDPFAGIPNADDRQYELPESKPQPTERIPEGLYATPSLTGNNDLDFWRVKHGRLPHVTFVNRVLGGHQDLSLPKDSKARIKTERITPVTQKSALAAILAFPGGPAASHELAGLELKFCRECGIHLTDETSRALGIGPVCRG